MSRLAALLAALSLTGCGTGAPPAPVPAGPPTGELRVGLLEYRLQLSAGTLRAGTVTVTATNVGSSSHDVVFTQNGQVVGGTALLSPGRSQTVQVQVAAGEVELKCTVTGHAQAGMTARMTVAG